MSKTVPSPLRRFLRNRYRNIPVKRKLLITVFVGSLSSVTFAGLILFAIQGLILRGEFRDHVVALSRIFADQSATALAFDDHEALQRILQSLSGKAEITQAAIILPDRSVAASTGVVVPADWELQANQAEEMQFKGWLLRAAHPIRVNNEVIGQLLVAANFKPVVFSALKLFVPGFIIVLTISLCLAVAITLFISRIFVRDLEIFTKITSRIADTSDVTLRVPIESDDEIGTLGRSFNRMIERLEQGDMRLRTSNVTLAEQIAAREHAEGRLLESSRLAGMAQVATGVLHNVGNVLNSVNISVQIIQETVTSHPRFNLLQQTTGLMKAQGDKLGQFLSEDPRGRLVPRLIMELGDQISGIQKELAREIGTLSQNVDHIKQIIAMQQNYAKAGGVVQQVAPSELFAESLRIAQASIARHGVVVTRSFADGPALSTDRHQLLQILVNFLTNAVQAVKPRAAGDRLVHLSVKYTSSNVQFAVTDNGVGISQEAMQKIFQHGFTTRKDGHGFGLHSGALAARNLGGQVRVESDGPGTGAQFTLEVPFDAPKPADLRLDPASTHDLSIV